MNIKKPEDRNFIKRKHKRYNRWLKNIRRDVGEKCILCGETLKRSEFGERFMFFKVVDCFIGCKECKLNARVHKMKFFNRWSLDTVYIDGKMIYDKELHKKIKRLDELIQKEEWI